MLCKECTDIFDCRSRYVGDQYLSVGTRALSKLKEVFGDRPEVDEYEKHHLEFARKLRDLDLSDRLPCPWYLRDLSWLGPVLQEEQELMVLSEGPRDGGAIVQAAVEGCELCRRVRLLASQYYDNGEITRVLFKCYITIDDISLKPHSLWISLTHNGNDDHRIALGLVNHGGRFPFRSSRKPTNIQYFTDNPLRFSVPRGHMTSDESCLRFLEQCLTNCLASHAECHEGGDTKWIPSRLLDVSTDSNSETVCLRERDEVLAKEKDDKHIHYLALSHIWGTAKFYTLTKDTFPSLKQGVNVTKLRQVFREAITLTRELNVRYLWIDSLW